MNSLPPLPIGNRPDENPLVREGVLVVAPASGEIELLQKRFERAMVPVDDDEHVDLSRPAISQPTSESETAPVDADMHATVSVDSNSGSIPASEPQLGAKFTVDVAPLAPAQPAGAARREARIQFPVEVNDARKTASPPVDGVDAYSPGNSSARIAPFETPTRVIGPAAEPAVAVRRPLSAPRMAGPAVAAAVSLVPAITSRPVAQVPETDSVPVSAVVSAAPGSASVGNDFPAPARATLSGASPEHAANPRSSQSDDGPPAFVSQPLSTQFLSPPVERVLNAPNRHQPASPLAGAVPALQRSEVRTFAPADMFVQVADESAHQQRHGQVVIMAPPAPAPAPAPARVSPPGPSPVPVSVPSVPAQLPKQTQWQTQWEPNPRPKPQVTEPESAPREATDLPPQPPLINSPIFVQRGDHGVEAVPAISRTGIPQSVEAHGTPRTIRSDVTAAASAYSLSEKLEWVPVVLDDAGHREVRPPIPAVHAVGVASQVQREPLAEATPSRPEMEVRRTEPLRHTHFGQVQPDRGTAFARSANGRSPLSVIPARAVEVMVPPTSVGSIAPTVAVNLPERSELSEPRANAASKASVEPVDLGALGNLSAEPGARGVAVPPLTQAKSAVVFQVPDAEVPTPVQAGSSELRKAVSSRVNETPVQAIAPVEADSHATESRTIAVRNAFDGGKPDDPTVHLSPSEGRKMAEVLSRAPAPRTSVPVKDLSSEPRVTPQGAPIPELPPIRVAVPSRGQQVSQPNSREDSRANEKRSPVVAVHDIASVPAAQQAVPRPAIERVLADPADVPEIVLPIERLKPRPTAEVEMPIASSNGPVLATRLDAPTDSLTEPSTGATLELEITESPAESPATEPPRESQAAPFFTRMHAMTETGPAPRDAQLQKMTEFIQSMAQDVMVSGPHADARVVRLVLPQDILPGVSVTVQQVAGQLQVTFEASVRSSWQRLDRSLPEMAKSVSRRLGRDVTVELMSAGDDAHSQPQVFAVSAGEML